MVVYALPDVRHIVDVIDRVVIENRFWSYMVRPQKIPVQLRRKLGRSPMLKSRWLRSRVAQRLNVQIGKELLSQLGVGG